MAKSNAVWGIDIGQCALKALRCRLHEKDPNRVVVEAFDYIEYPKILTQPEADRESLVREALELFISRNELTGDRVAISVPGQSGLARFIKLPPVETKKIPDIVRYEARQQIPFALDDVVWDYQPLAGGSQDEGYALETEVGLFAMKRDQVARALKPLEEAGIDVDIIQLTPLAVYNFVCFDQLGNLESADPGNPPLSKVVISLGTDTTDLVVTNGFRVWQRSIPIGGNHFTKSLTKELKLTFAKAEHLKRNATKAENPKAVFQAMRPVFSDLVAEIQRSLGFFTSNNRDAKLGEVIALGNPMKLPGLQRYLSQNLDQEVEAVGQFNNLMGGSVTAVPQFKDNQLTFAVAYGLCVQALGRSQISTNLLPEEIVTSRLVSAKKPWAVAAAALLLVGIAINYVSHYSAWRSADVDNPEMQNALSASQDWTQEARTFDSTNAELTAKFDQVTTIGYNLQSNVDGRLLWLELLKAIDSALPKDERLPDEREETVEDISHREELHIKSLDCEHFDDLSTWFAGVSSKYEAARKAAEMEMTDETADGAGEAGDNPDAAVAEDPNLTAGAEAAYQDGTYQDGTYQGDPSQGAGAAVGPTGPGWVIELTGHHFHNGDDLGFDQGERFIHNTFFRNLEEGVVRLPDGENGELVEVKLADLGISHPVVLSEEKIINWTYFKELDADPRDQPMRTPVGPGRPPAAGAAAAEDVGPETLKLRRYDFTIQFCWRPQPRGERSKTWAEQGDEGARTAAAEDRAAGSTGDSM